MDRDQLGPFLLLEKVGEGGMGVVYKARDTRLDRPVAIKLLAESGLADPDRRARFMQEARAASALNHPGIVTVHDIAEQDGRHYIVMEFVDGKPLNELIPRKGMRLVEALRIGVQIADALTAAHAAGIVHRDLKPGNIMVDAQGRAKVLDFGLAKLTARDVSATPDVDATRTAARDEPRTEAGAILGSVPYMSPEQAEGRPVDARSDIFSFGAVLYEMVTGQRAFQGESRISTLAAIVERDPRPPSEVASGVPVELERVIARCLRKDVARRSQHMSDIKLALEELRDESESGKLVHPAGAAMPPSAAGRRWLWPAVAAACAVMATAVVGWNVLRRGTSPPTAAQLVRVTPDDGYSYTSPAISPDGKFVAAISDRGGTEQLWLQQVGGADPIQVTRSVNRVRRADFFPDGTRLLVWTQAGDGSGNGALEIVPTLGGQSRELLSGKIAFAALSPDGRQVAYFTNDGGQYRLAVIPTEGGPPRVIEKWGLTQGQLLFPGCGWAPDGRALAVGGSKRREAANLDEWEWFALPLDGADPVATGAGDVLRAAGFGFTRGGAIAGDRVIFPGTRKGRTNVWEIRFTPGSWRVRGSPRQLTFGTENEIPSSVSGAGTLAIQSSRDSSDLYLLPIDPDSGHASGPARRLTRDGRQKLPWGIGGDPGTLYFRVLDRTGRGPVYVGSAVDLTTSQQRQLNRGLDMTVFATVSPDGREIAYSRPDGDTFSISLGDVGAGPETARPLCGKCGYASRFSPDGRYLLIWPEWGIKPDPKRKTSTALLELPSGKITPWFGDTTESVTVGGFLGGEWAIIRTQRPGEESTQRSYVARWRPTPIPRSEWVEFRPPRTIWHYSLSAPLIYAFQDSRLMAVRFDPKQRRFGEPFPVRMPPGSPVEIQSTDNWIVRGPGITFARQQTNGSVWLMKLPE